MDNASWTNPEGRPLESDFDVIGAIIAYEEGELDEGGTNVLFQYLVDTGLAWTLQGHYGRMALTLIEAGFVVRFPEPY